MTLAVIGIFTYCIGMIVRCQVEPLVDLDPNLVSNEHLNDAFIPLSLKVEYRIWIKKAPPPKGGGKWGGSKSGTRKIFGVRVTIQYSCSQSASSLLALNALIAGGAAALLYDNALDALQ
jgi:hypothetical protein